MEQRTRFGVILGLWAAGLGAAAQFGKISVSFSMLEDVYGTTGAALGFVVSLVGLVGIIFGVTASLIVAQIGYRRALIVALVLGA
ncbi:MAG: MFS transporter, partial [Rhodobacteraceae bacterium]|nr:MFS transporter [Paracoccaceae bacterium]